MKPAGAIRLATRIIGVAEAMTQCSLHHRHLPKVRGGLVGLEVIRADTRWPCAWGIVGRPSSRHLQADGWVELTRGIVPDSAPPSCASAVLGAAARWARKQGAPIVTYTMSSEPGTSLLAAGWVQVGFTKPAKTWARASRDRGDRVGILAAPKRRWVAAWCLDTALERGWLADPRLLADPSL